jgi:uncharacterized protein with NRDE domain
MGEGWDGGEESSTCLSIQKISPLMCLIVFNWQPSADITLQLAANRDEWHARSAAPAAWWSDQAIYAGRDLQAGGTWLGVTRAGRFAALTNFRDPSERKSNAPSRGELVTRFLLNDASPADFLRALAKDSARYAGFNFLCSDGRQLGYLSSPTATVAMLMPGTYALSNGVLDAPWPKVTRVKSLFDVLIETSMPEEARQMASFSMLNDTHIAADDALPDTGVGIEWERRLSAIKIVSPDYGTRCSTVLEMRADGEIVFREWTYANDGAVTSESHVAFSPG